MGAGLDVVERPAGSAVLKACFLRIFAVYGEGGRTRFGGPQELDGDFGGVALYSTGGRGDAIAACEGASAQVQSVQQQRVDIITMLVFWHLIYWPRKYSNRYKCGIKSSP